MLQYLGRRLVSTLPVLVLLTAMVFSMLHLIPGDPVEIMLGAEADPQTVAALRSELGLNRPVYEQYFMWLGRVLQGDLGRSFRTHEPVAEAIVKRLPVTLELAILSLLVSLIIGLPAGIVSATRRNSHLDMLGTSVAMLGISVPSFFLGIVLIFIFALQLRWLAPSGFVPLGTSWTENLKLMIMPAITLGAVMAGTTMRFTRSSMLEVLNQEYILTARAKGLRESIVIRVHALKNALIPIVTIVGLETGTLLGGAVLVETIFALPGVGRLIVNNIFARDFPVVQGAVLFLALVRLGTNFAVDLLYAYLDPRIRYA